MEGKIMHRSCRYRLSRITTRKGIR